MLTCDRVKRRQRPTKTGRAERDFQTALTQIAEHVGTLIAGFPAGDIEAVPRLQQLLSSYADLLTPWAVNASKQLIDEVNARDLDSWRSLGTSISQQLHRDLTRSPLGDVINQLMREQVTLIKSLPVEAGQRVHELTVKGLENSERASSYVDEIMRSGEVSKSRAQLIARTETSRTATTLLQARAMQAGLTHYIWRTSRDGSVRPGHRAMEGKVCEFANPPAVEENGTVMHFHPGNIWNCRCYPEPIIADYND